MCGHYNTQSSPALLSHDTVPVLQLCSNSKMYNRFLQLYTVHGNISINLGYIVFRFSTCTCRFLFSEEKNYPAYNYILSFLATTIIICSLSTLNNHVFLAKNLQTK